MEKCVLQISFGAKPVQGSSNQVPSHPLIHFFGLFTVIPSSLFLGKDLRMCYTFGVEKKERANAM